VIKRFSCAIFCCIIVADPFPVLYHQPEKMARTANDLAERQENLEKLKREHGIE